MCSGTAILKHLGPFHESYRFFLEYSFCSRFPVFSVPFDPWASYGLPPYRTCLRKIKYRLQLANPISATPLIFGQVSRCDLLCYSFRYRSIDVLSSIFRCFLFWWVSGEVAAPTSAFVITLMLASAPAVPGRRSCFLLLLELGVVGGSVTCFQGQATSRELG